MNKYMKKLTTSVKGVWKWYRKQHVLVQAVILIAVIFLAASLPRMDVISGYDGIVAEITSAECDYDHKPGDKYLDTASAGFDLDGWWAAVGVWFDPTGLKLEIGAGVNVDKSSTEILAEPDEVIHNNDGTVTTKQWVIQKVKCYMGATATTYGEGIGKVTNAVFWITLNENDFTVFSDANESYAYILHVYTRSVTLVDDNERMVVVPIAGGYTFPMTTLGTDPVPEWLKDSGYRVDNLQGLSKVKFPLKIQSAEPDSFLAGFRDETQATWDIGIDVFLAGYWEVTQDEHEWIPPDPDNPTLWDMLFGDMDIFGDFDTEGIFVMVALVAGAIFVFWIFKKFSGGAKQQVVILRQGV